jgi:hypothetical protein
MADWTDERVIEEARKWRWRPPSSKVVSYERFDLVLYPESWNENFVEAKSLPNQNPESLVEEVVAAASQLHLSKLAWRVSSSPDSLKLERVLEDAGFAAEKMDELLAWELGDGSAPMLPGPVGSGEVIAEQVTNFEHYQAARRVEAAAFGYKLPSEQELEQEWSSATAESEEASKFARFFSRIGNVPRMSRSSSLPTHPHKICSNPSRKLGYCGVQPKERSLALLTLLLVQARFRFRSRGTNGGRGRPTRSQTHWNHSS